MFSDLLLSAIIYAIGNADVSLTLDVIFTVTLNIDTIVVAILVFWLSSKNKDNNGDDKRK